MFKYCFFVIYKLYIQLCILLKCFLFILLSFSLSLVFHCFSEKKRFIASPIGKIYKLKEKPARPPPPVEILENAFRKSKAIPKGTALEVNLVHKLLK